MLWYHAITTFAGFSVPGFAGYDPLCAYCKLHQHPACSWICVGQLYGPQSSPFSSLGLPSPVIPSLQRYYKNVHTLYWSFYRPEPFDVRVTNFYDHVDNVINVNWTYLIIFFVCYILLNTDSFNIWNIRCLFPIHADNSYSRCRFRSENVKIPQINRQLLNDISLKQYIDSVSGNQ